MSPSPLDLTIVDRLVAAAEADPGHEIVAIDGLPVTTGWWLNESRRAAMAFTSLGLRRGDRVVTFLSNRTEALVVWIGLALIGVVEVPINTAMKGDLLADQIVRSRSRLVLVETELAGRIDEVRDRLEPVENVLVVGGDGDDFASLVREAPEMELPPPPAPDDEALVLYTSGTTGRSKGVILTHRANARLATAVVENVEIDGNDVLYTAFPLFHVAARFVSVMPALIVGGRVVVHRRFSASRFWDICREEGVTAIHYLGTLPMMVFAQPLSSSDRDHGVRIAYGAGMPTDIWERFVQRFGIERVHELYGSTEQGIVTINTIDNQTTGTCGRPTDYATVEIHDDRDLPVAPGTDGEIVIRPEQAGILFRGYDAMPEATIEAWRNLWFHTGDRGRFDEDGNLVFLGRLKDAIRRRGENVSAFEVERVLDAHPAVSESAAVGVPSEIGEEEVLAVLVSTAPLDPVDVAEHCQKHLPAFAVPRYIRVVDSLPKNSSERVVKSEIAFVDGRTWDRQAASGLQPPATRDGASA